MDESKEECASKVELRRFTALLSKLDDGNYWCVETKRKFLQIQNNRFYTLRGRAIADQAHSGNTVVDKCIITFSTLVLEVDILVEKAQSTFYNALIVYGEDVDRCLATEGGTVKMIARFMPRLQELHVFVNRCYEVFRNIICQLHAFLSSRNNLLEQAQERKLLRMWRSLGLLLSVLITLDQIIRRQSTLQQHWQSYYRAIQLISHNPSQFNAESELLHPLQRVVTGIDQLIMQATLYKSCCQQIFEKSLHADHQLSERMKSAIIEMFEKWERIASIDVPEKQRLMAIIALSLCHMFLFRSVDKKLMRTVWNNYKKLPLFHLIGHVVWCPCEFILENLIESERIIDKKMVAQMTAVKSTQIAQHMDALSREAANVALVKLIRGLQLDEWQCLMNEELKMTPERSTKEHTFQRVSLFLRGIRYADMLCHLLKTLMSNLLVEQKAISRSSASAAFRLIETIKAVERVYGKWWPVILETCQNAVQYCSVDLIRLISVIRETIRGDTDLSYRIVDTLSALTVAENALAGSVSRTSLIVTGIALEMACYSKLFRGIDAEKADELLSRLETLSTLGQIISRVCNCSFLFWHRSFIAAYFGSIIEDDNARPELFFDAVNDIEMLLGSDDNELDLRVQESIRDELYELYEKSYLKNLCEAVETDLRLTIHSHLQLDDRTPKDPMHDTNMRLVNLLQMPALQLFDRLIDVRRYVEKYLEKTFYNLTAVALHDSHTYMEMSLLAKHKYGLLLCESRLPFQKLDQGPDVLFVARNIDSFAQSYNYNLNEQFFIEKDSKSKQLTILTMEHIANSIRTHGMGIMNTTINYAYQFLKKKFYIFSQFLYDDRIRNQLIKDERFFHENAEKLGKMYPVNRAQRFNTAIRRLGVTEDDLSYLDKLRTLITEIGNVMGYVRLVRSGGVEASMQSLAFLPDPDDIPSFEPLAAAAGLSPESVDAARVLDSVFEVAKKNINQSDNYLQILVEVFSPELRDTTKYEHLNFFYMIVPPLTINYVDQMLACKGKLGRRAKQNNTFTDDGFVLGVAFILALLDQHSYFASLNWFHSIAEGCGEAVSNATQGAGVSRGGGGVSSSRSTAGGSLDPSVAIRLAKLDHYRKEFQLLSHTFSSAKIFFSSNTNNDTINTASPSSSNVAESCSTSR